MTRLRPPPTRPTPPGRGPRPAAVPVLLSLAAAATILLALGCPGPTMGELLDGKQCGPAGECAQGYQCDTHRNICVPLGMATGGAGGAGGDAGSGGDAGAGGGCDGPEDCPGADTTCGWRTCEAGQCGTANAAAATPCTEDDGQICDGSGSCVECLTAEHCDPEWRCDNNQCLPPTCMDGVKNGDETDLDCGGSCPPCDNGRSCETAADCASLFCDDGAGGAGGFGGAGGAGGFGGGAGGGAPGTQCAPCGGYADCLDAPAPSYCAAGQCVGQEANGTACAADEQCLSGQCVDGYCCELPCGGLCVACAALFTGEQNGTCEPITAGTDPNGECSGALTCDGAGSCS